VGWVCGQKIMQKTILFLSVFWYHRYIKRRIFMHQMTTITLGSHFEQFISQQILEGRFASANEVICAGLQVLEASQTQLKIVQNALKDGEASGFADYSLAAIITELDHERVT
jgi:antitoxin ParD1/3/4